MHFGYKEKMLKAGSHAAFICASFQLKFEFLSFFFFYFCRNALKNSVVIEIEMFDAFFEMENVQYYSIF